MRSFGCQEQDNSGGYKKERKKEKNFLETSLDPLETSGAWRVFSSVPNPLPPSGVIKILRDPIYGKSVAFPLMGCFAREFLLFFNLSYGANSRGRFPAGHLGFIAMCPSREEPMESVWRGGEGRESGKVIFFWLLAKSARYVPVSRLAPRKRKQKCPFMFRRKKFM